MERTERIESMKWNKGFSARYFITLVDRVTWRDKEVYPILSGKIDRGREELMESADIELRKLPKDGECWIRVYMEARQEGESPSKVALFTGLISAPERVINGKVESYAAECYSALKPAADVLMQRGWYAPVGVEGAVLIKKLLSVGNAPVFYEEYSPSLTKPIVAEDGESNLSMAQKIVKAIGWNIHISGEGIIHICPKSEDIKVTFDALENDSIEMKVTDTLDWYSCPNVYRVVTGDVTATARDDDPESILSTVSRGREIWMEETDCELSAGETIGEYAYRRLKEIQSPSRTIKYDRRFFPEIYPGDLVRMHYPEFKLDNIFRIKNQSITLGYGSKVTEEAVMI